MQCTSGGVLVKYKIWQGISWHKGERSKIRSLGLLLFFFNHPHLQKLNGKMTLHLTNSHLDWLFSSNLQWLSLPNLYIETSQVHKPGWAKYDLSVLKITHAVAQSLHYTSNQRQQNVQSVAYPNAVCISFVTMVIVGCIRRKLNTTKSPQIEGVYYTLHQ